MKQSRENNFGRRIFEAFAVEYMTSYFAEGSKVKMLEGKIEQLKEQSLRKSEYMEKAKRLTETAMQRKTLLKEKVERGHVLHELLDPLVGENKQQWKSFLVVLRRKISVKVTKDICLISLVKIKARKRKIQVQSSLPRKSSLKQLVTGRMQLQRL